MILTLSGTGITGRIVSGTMTGYNSKTFYDYATGTEIPSLEPGKTYTGVVLVITD